MTVKPKTPKHPPLLTQAKVPKSLTILGQEFKIVLCDLEEGVYGETHGYERVIRVSRRQSEVHLHRTLVHEAVHAMLHITGHCEHLSENEEEALTMAFEATFADIIDIDKLGE